MLTGSGVMAINRSNDGGGAAGDEILRPSVLGLVLEKGTCKRDREGVEGRLVRSDRRDGKSLGSLVIWVRDVGSASGSLTSA